MYNSLRSGLTWLVLVAAAGGCDGDGSTVDARGDAAVADAGDARDAAASDATATDATGTDATGGDATGTDGMVAVDAALDAPPAGACQPLDLTPAQACQIAYTGEVTPCQLSGGVPSPRGYLDVRRPDDSHGYVCGVDWTAADGYYLADRTHVRAQSAGCCGGPSAAIVPWPAAHPDLGIPHAPTHVKPGELVADTGGAIRQNPFAVIVSGPATAAAFQEARTTWAAWSGDGQAHPAPDGTGAYYFPAFLVINYVVVPTTTGQPLLVLAPEPSLDPGFTRPLGHPSMGLCSGQGGVPMAFIAGDLQGTTLTNGSGRYGFESTVTAANLAAAAALFNCHGIPVDDVIFTPP